MTRFVNMFLERVFLGFIVPASLASLFMALLLGCAEVVREKKVEVEGPEHYENVQQLILHGTDDHGRYDFSIIFGDVRKQVHPDSPVPTSIANFVLYPGEFHRVTIYYDVGPLNSQTATITYRTEGCVRRIESAAVHLHKTAKIGSGEIKHSDGI